jgi:hypothetical protein
VFLIKRSLITFLVIYAFAVFGSVNGIASVVSDPQYYVRAQVVEIEPVRGGLHAIRFIVKELVERQEKYGGYNFPEALPEEISVEEPHIVQIALNPRVSIRPGDIIVVGVIHGSSMGESEPVPWVMFAHPYYEDGTPIGLYYGERN